MQKPAGLVTHYAYGSRIRPTGKRQPENSLFLPVPLSPCPLVSTIPQCQQRSSTAPPWPFKSARPCASEPSSSPARAAPSSSPPSSSAQPPPPRSTPRTNPRPAAPSASTIASSSSPPTPRWTTSAPPSSASTTTPP